jgi:hypothetical protein
MALIHHQFESIHPFYDGNGRTGRIVNVLYLVKEGLLDIPVLYLSRHIVRTKADYYRLLQAVRDEDALGGMGAVHAGSRGETAGQTIRPSTPSRRRCSTTSTASAPNSSSTART